MLEYLFTSDRLGFRNWKAQDLKPMSMINSNADVMKYFPRTQTTEETERFIHRMQDQFEATGFCYFAVDELDSRQLIGFIGLSAQTYEADFTPCIDIGWRLDKIAWGRGFATEGARRCMSYAKNDLKLNKLCAVASINNVKSISIMKKIGMAYVSTFDHSLLKDYESIKSCVLYEYNFTDGI